MARAKKCEACKKRAVKGPRASFCAAPECERARARARRRKADLEARQRRADDTRKAEEAPPTPAGGVFASTLFALQQAGRVHTPAAQQALTLATRLDNGAEDSGSSLAALGKQHLAALAEALRDLEAVDDPADELAQRRAAHGG